MPASVVRWIQSLQTGENRKERFPNKAKTTTHVHFCTFLCHIKWFNSSLLFLLKVLKQSSFWTTYLVGPFLKDPTTSWLLVERGIDGNCEEGILLHITNKEDRKRDHTKKVHEICHNRIRCNIVIKFHLVNYAQWKFQIT